MVIRREGSAGIEGPNTTDARGEEPRPIPATAPRKRVITAAMLAAQAAQANYASYAHAQGGEVPPAPSPGNPFPPSPGPSPPPPSPGPGGGGGGGDNNGGHHKKHNDNQRHDNQRNNGGNDGFTLISQESSDDIDDNIDIDLVNFEVEEFSYIFNPALLFFGDDLCSPLNPNWVNELVPGCIFTD